MTSERDAELSALLDGALAAPEERALRAELAGDPALAARLAQLERVDAALRALPARPVPADLRARLEAKRIAEASAPRQLGANSGGAPARPSRRRAWIAGFSAAAAAAAAALVVLVAGPNAKREPVANGATELAARPVSDPPADARVANGRQLASEQAAGLAAPAVPGSTTPPSAGASPNPASLAAAANPAAASDAEPSLADASPPVMPRPGAQDLALAPSPPDPEVAGAAPGAAAANGAPSLDRATELAAAASPGGAAQPALWIEATDDEASALGELEPADAGVVAVLDWLSALDALEAEAS